MCWLAGHLHFVNVLPEDAKDGATYVCNAQNRVMRGFQSGEYNKIIPRGGTVDVTLSTGVMSFLEEVL